jgi:molecular chaperone DnaK (HSP70)
MSKIYGIDLGTTYSCIASVDNYGKAVVHQNSEGQPTTPSVVYFEDANNICVGKTAKDVAALHPDLVISAIKRSMGDQDWVYSHNGTQYRPQQISSFILKKLVEDAQNQLTDGTKITDVVITCPAYFGVTQKEATKQAGIIAGLNVLYVIPEPTAAAIAYGVDQIQDQIILVYDLGGGTFDVTLISVTTHEIKVICTGGDARLGGKNWDETLASWLAEQFALEAGGTAEELINDSETWQELLIAAENIKVSLSTRTSVDQAIRHGAKRVKVKVTVEKFDELTAHILERTFSLTDTLLETAKKKGYTKIDRLLLVGGSTYMSQVKNRVAQKYNFEVLQFDPNQAVAKGAALFGFKCQLDAEIKIAIAEETGESTKDLTNEDIPIYKRKQAEKYVAQIHGLALPGLQKLINKKIRNVTSKSFGIVVTDLNDPNEIERVQNLIVIDDEVPTTISHPFFTTKENQTSVLLRCVENIQRIGPYDGFTELSDSIEVGRTNLEFGKVMPKHSPIEVTFKLAEDGLLSLHGLDLTDNNNEINAIFETAAILSQQEIEASKAITLAKKVS